MRYHLECGTPGRESPRRSGWDDCLDRHCNNISYKLMFFYKQVDVVRNTILLDGLPRKKAHRLRCA